MKIVIKHLPTGETWESGPLREEDADALHDLCRNATDMYIDTQTQGRYYFNAKILSECVINLRP